MIANRITESAIKEFAVELLEKQGFQYVYGPDIAPDKDVQVSRAQDAQERQPDIETLERQSFEDALLLEKLRLAVARINHLVPINAREDAIKQVLHLNSPSSLPLTRPYLPIYINFFNHSVHHIHGGNTLSRIRISLPSFENQPVFFCEGISSALPVERTG
jgi:hypothetical protein